MRTVRIINNRVIGWAFGGGTPTRAAHALQAAVCKACGGAPAAQHRKTRVSAHRADSSTLQGVRSCGKTPANHRSSPAEQRVSWRSEKDENGHETNKIMIS
jgi:hypothetical protein